MKGNMAGSRVLGLLLRFARGILTFNSALYFTKLVLSILFLVETVLSTAPNSAAIPSNKKPIRVPMVPTLAFEQASLRNG